MILCFKWKTRERLGRPSYPRFLRRHRRRLLPSIGPTCLPFHLIRHLLRLRLVLALRRSGHLLTFHLNPCLPILAAAHSSYNSHGPTISAQQPRGKPFPPKG